MLRRFGLFGFVRLGGCGGPDRRKPGLAPGLFDNSVRGNLGVSTDPKLPQNRVKVKKKPLWRLRRSFAYRIAAPARADPNGWDGRMEFVLGALAPGAGPRRGGPSAEPIRRHSRPKGRLEAMFWRPFRPKDVGRYLTAAERFERAGKKPGSRSGPLGVVALEVLRELLRLVDYKTGRLDPALTTLMARTRRSRDAVVRALAALRRHGFVDWVRRYVPTGNLGPGPQVQQTSNAYRLVLPPAAERLLGRAGEDAPLPEDHVHAVAAREAARQAQLASAEPEERNAALFGSGVMSSTFSRIERALELRRERESARQTESRQESKI